jgi:2'-5' RNA ligase
MWRQIAEAGISSHLHESGVRPHLTLAVGDQVDGPSVETVLREWGASNAARQITFNGLGLSPSERANVFLTPIVTEDLLELHRGLHDKLEGLVDSPWTRYLPGHWVPHCTIVERVPQIELARTIEIARSAPFPVKANLVEIALVEFSPFLHRAAFPLLG